MILKKIKITDINVKGQGIGRNSELVVFVNGAIPGDVVDVNVSQKKKNYYIGDIQKYIINSPISARPKCQFFSKCGGCQIQNIDYEAQLKLKTKIVENCFNKIAGNCSVKINETVGMEKPYYYRNKAQYKPSEHGLGFYAVNSHQVVPIDKCIIQDKSSRQFIEIINKTILQTKTTIYNEGNNTGYLRGVHHRIAKNGKQIVTLIINSTKVENEKIWVQNLKDNIADLAGVFINFNTEKANRILGKKTEKIYGEDYLIETIGEKVFRISPQSFFQVNPYQTEKMFEFLKNNINLTADKILDIYCGTGTIGQYIASKSTKITGVETTQKAIEDAFYNAKLNGIAETEYVCGKAEEKIPDLLKKENKPDLVILDPPRKGCEASLLKLISEYEIPQIAYISCNPATLARDVKILNENHYELTSVQPFDMFPQTMHVETIALLQRTGS